MKEIAMPLTTLRQFLDSKQIKYIVITDPLAYTAQGVAATAHIPGKELAETSSTWTGSWPWWSFPHPARWTWSVESGYWREVGGSCIRANV